MCLPRGPGTGSLWWSGPSPAAGPPLLVWFKSKRCWLLSLAPCHCQTSDGGDETPLLDDHLWDPIRSRVYLEGSQAASSAELASVILSPRTSQRAGCTHPFPGPPLAFPRQAAPGPLTLVSALSSIVPTWAWRALWRDRGWSDVERHRCRCRAWMEVKLTAVGCGGAPSSQEAEEPRPYWAERS